MEIICPICKEKLNKIDNSYRCINRHNYDIAKQGYLNLSNKSSNKTGDEKEMVQARNEFLNKDYYLFLKDKLNEIIDQMHVTNLLDLACGEGYYTKSFKVKDKVGIDLSKEALKIASKNDIDTTYILKTIFDVPFKDDSIDLITTIFAPISKEINRLLKKDGYFILVKPDVYHLFELKQAVYDKPYLNQVEDIHIDGLKIIKEYKIKDVKSLNRQDTIALFKMTPYYHKTSLKDFNKLENIDNLDITFAFIIDVYQTSK